MKMRKDKDVLNVFYISLSMILVGIFIWILHIHALGGGLILGGSVLLIANIYFATKPRTEVVADERIKRINDKAGHYAFWVVLLFLSILFLIDLYDLFEIHFKEANQIALLVGIYTWFILRFYFSKRGNLE